MKFSISIRLLQRVRRAALAFLALAVLCFSGAAAAAVYLSVTIAPPPIPVYAQPICPGPGYIWTPGYWAYGPGGWYWVAGAWVLPPYIGALWTPGYWGWSDGYYRWHTGYWGRGVGFYGGVHYGYGYTGSGYSGGYWRGNAFYYNRTVNNVNTTVVRTTYRAPVNNVTTSRVSYYGGRGGTTARANAAQFADGNPPHDRVTTAQVRRENAAQSQRSMLASSNAEAQRTATIRHQGVTGVHNASPHNASPDVMRSQRAPVHNAAPNIARTEAPAREAPTHVARAQAPSSPASAHPGGGRAPSQPRTFADAGRAQAHASAAAAGPRSGRGARPDEGGDGRHG